MSNEEAIRVPAVLALFWAEAIPAYINPNPDGANYDPDPAKRWRSITGRKPRIACAFDQPPPRGVSAIVDESRGVAFLRNPIYYDPPPTETQLQSVPSPSGSSPSATMSGVATPLDGRYHPRRFATPTLGAAQSPLPPFHLPFWPTLQATEIGEAGAIILNLRWSDGAPASWAVLAASCVRDAQTFNFSGQADVRGDVIVPLTGLPPPRAANTNYGMTLNVRADESVSGASAANPDALPAVQFAVDGATFAAQQTVSTPRGAISTVQSLNIKSVLLQSK